jgi:alkylation response protein AidB-like acyl-CoA dehydrogenase
MAEDVETFGRRARSWIDSNVPRPGEVAVSESGARVRRAQEIQRSIYDAGFAGITWPKRYGGQELTPAYMHAFVDQLRGFENPYPMLSVSLGVIGPTLLEFGTDQQKDKFLPALLRGDTLWVQLLSEPSGGSDMAGVLTGATRDGETWVLNGSKVWTTFGHHADYGLCLARTNWEVQKHRGLSVFIVPMQLPGVTVRPLTQASGASEFCQEFLDEVSIPSDHLLGRDNDGWTVASALLVQERNALGGGSPWFAGGPRGDPEEGETNELVGLALRSGLWEDSHIRQRVADCHSAEAIGAQLAARIAAGIRNRTLPGPAGSMLKLFAANLHLQRTELSMELCGADTAAWQEGDDAAQASCMAWLTRQGTAIMGGTNEIQRNIISERVLGMPREPAPDKDIPFNQVRTNHPGGGS